MLTAFAATLQDDLELTEVQIEHSFARFLERVPERLRDRIVRTASMAVLQISQGNPGKTSWLFLALESRVFYTVSEVRAYGSVHRQITYS